MVSLAIPAMGLHLFPANPNPGADRAPMPDPRGFSPSAGHSQPVGAGALPRSRQTELRPTPLLAIRGGLDPDRQSAGVFWIYNLVQVL